MDNDKNVMELETFRLRVATERLIAQSILQRREDDLFAARSGTGMDYRVSPLGTDPEMWVIERTANNGGKPQQLILFENKEGAHRVLQHFNTRLPP